MTNINQHRLKITNKIQLKNWFNNSSYQSNIKKETLALKLLKNISCLMEVGYFYLWSVYVCHYG